jgi:hypothetical protein
MHEKHSIGISDLQEAFQLAVTDLEDHSPAGDPFRSCEYDFDKDVFLDWIKKQLANSSYRPGPLLNIDLPKSEFTYRPASRIELRDLVVLFYIVLQIAEDAETKLGPHATAYRLKRITNHGKQRCRIMRESSYILPRHLRKRYGITVPWYDAWPAFRKALRKKFDRGAKVVGQTDITSFFEDIDLAILRRNLSHLCSSKKHHLVSLLIEMLSTWVIRDSDDVRQNRGIPQGTDISGILSNYFLARQDSRLSQESKRRSVDWYRYCDDMCFLGKKYEAVREMLLLVGDLLKENNLIQNSSKTKILEGRTAERALFDPRPELIKSALAEWQKTKRFPRRLYSIARTMKRSSHPEFDKVDSMVLALLYTAFTILKESLFLRQAFDDMKHLPLRTPTICRYLRVFAKRQSIKRKVLYQLQIIKTGKLRATSFEKAELLRLCRSFDKPIPGLVALLHRYAQAKYENWYVRQQAILSSLYFLDQPKIDKAIDLLESDCHNEIKRACLACLCIVPRPQRDQMLLRNARKIEPKVSRFANFLLELGHKPELALHHLKKFSSYNESFWGDSFWRLAFIQPSIQADVGAKYRRVLKITKSATDAAQIRRHLAWLQSFG